MKNIIICGIDHVGKDTIINKILEKENRFVIHAGKPTNKYGKVVFDNKDVSKKPLQIILKTLFNKGVITFDGHEDINEYLNSCLIDNVLNSINVDFNNPLTSSWAPILYQAKYFTDVRNIITDSDDSVKFLCNRMHLGEHVYGTLYRKKPYDIEFWANELFENEFIINYTKLILLEMDNYNNRIYDPEAFSNNAHMLYKESELFREAFANSKIIDKKIIRTTHKGRWINPDYIYEQIIS